MALKKESSYKILFLIFGIVLAVMSVAFPIKYLALFLIGIVGFVFTFYQLEISLGLFILFMTIIPHTFWNNMLFVLACLFYFGVFIIQVIAKKRKPLSIKQINIPLMFFVFFSTYSVCIASNFSDSVRIFILLLSAILFSIIIMSLIQDEKILNFYMDILSLSVFVTAGYGILQKFLGIEIRAEFIDMIVSSNMPGRLYSTMDNPNNYAEYLILFIPLCMSHFLNTKNELKKFVILGIIMMGVYSLIYTLSRGAYITFVVGAFIYLLMINAKIVPFGIIIGVMLIPLVPEFLINRLLSIGKDSSSSFRIMIWEGALLTLKDHWVTGVGMGPESFKHIFANYATSEASRAMHSHNLFLQVMLDSGVAGFISFVVFLYTFFKSNFVNYLNSNKYYKNLFAAFIFSIIAYVAFGMVEYVWFYPRVMLTFWIVIGLSFGTVNLAKGDVK